MTAEVTVKNWGNSQGIRLPKKILDALDISAEDTLDVRVEDQRLILEKKFRHKTFEERVAAYGGEVSVMPFDWGEPKGKEML